MTYIKHIQPQQRFKMHEKYNVEDLSKESGVGEYPIQDGFG